MPVPSFRGRLAWASNMWDQYPVVYNNITFRSGENLYVYLKVKDPDLKQKIISCNPAEAKKLGRAAEPIEGWENPEVRLKVMLTVQLAKYSNTQTAQLLDATNGEKLVELNYWHDNFWGDCQCRKCAGTPGQNHLGKLIMQIRNLRQIGKFEEFKAKHYAS